MEILKWIVTRLVASIVALMLVDVIAQTSLAAYPSNWLAVVGLIAMGELILYANITAVVSETQPVEGALQLARQQGRLKELRRMSKPRQTNRTRQPQQDQHIPQNTDLSEEERERRLDELDLDGTGEIDELRDEIHETAETWGDEIDTAGDGDGSSE